jgi:hypothetical protein
MGHHVVHLGCVTEENCGQHGELGWGGLETAKKGKECRRVEAIPSCLPVLLRRLLKLFTGGGG